MTTEQGRAMTWTSLRDEPTIRPAHGFHLDDDAEARKVLRNDATWLGDILEDNGGEPDGPAWIVFPLDDVTREELRRFQVRGEEVSGFMVEAYSAEAHRTDYELPWMGSTKNRVAFFLSERDAQRAVAALVSCRQQVAQED